MTTGGSQEHLSIGKAAWKGLKKNFGEIITVAIVTVLLRAAVFLPMLLCVDFGGKLPTWMGWTLAAAAYIAGVISMRFWGREKMRRLFYSRHMNHRRKGVYKKWLKTGLLRYARGILWGFPFLVGAVYFTVFRRTLDAKTFWMPVRRLAVLAGQEANLGAGLVVTLILMTVFGLLFAYGWWRDLPVEYLPVRSLGAVRTLHWSRRILKKHRKEMRGNTFVNFFLSLPALIGFGAVLVPYVRANVDFSLSADMMATQVLRLLRTPLPTAELIKLAGATAVLYVPFWIFRKTRNAVLMARLMRENAHSIHSSEQRGEESASSLATPKAVAFTAGESGEKKETPPPAADDAPKETPPPAADDASKETPPAAQTDEKNDLALDAARMAQEAARMAQEAAEHAARVAENAARIAQGAAKNKQG